MANYKKMYDLFDLALWMQETSEGLSLEDIEQKYNVSRRTAERIRNALMTYFPQMEEVETGERTKRWRITQRSLNSFISFSAEELAVFKTAIDKLKQGNLKEKAETLVHIELKLRNLLKPEQKNKIEVDADELMKSEGLVLHPGPQIELNKEILNTLRQAILSCHPGRLLEDGTYSDARAFTPKELMLLTGLPDNYKVPTFALNDDKLIRDVIGECVCPLMERKIMELIPR